MSRFLPRFTVRRLMVAVAVIAIVLATGRLLNDRRRRFAILANEHGYKAIEELKAKRPGPHLGLWAKYRDAAHHPWLPVAPDPPGTE